MGITSGPYQSESHADIIRGNCIISLSDVMSKEKKNKENHEVLVHVFVVFSGHVW